MAKIKPFRAIRPQRDKVHLVATNAFYYYKKNVLEAILDSNPYSFLHIINPELKKDDQTEPNSLERFQKVKDEFHRFQGDNILNKDEQPSYYIYRQTGATGTFTGIIAATSIDDYVNDTVKKHEATLTQREQTFKKYLDICEFNAEPVLMCYPDDEDIQEILWAYTMSRPEFEFSTSDRIKHELWIIQNQEDLEMVEKAFEPMEAVYIADGHHRSASSTLHGLGKREENPGFSGDEPFNYFMAYYLPESELKIYDFNRVIKDLNGLSKEEFLDAIKERFNISTKGKTAFYPAELHSFSMYMEGEWYELTSKEGSFNPSDAVGVLDSEILSVNLLDPVLGIKDLKTDQRASFIGGLEGMEGLKNAVDSGKYQVAFGLFPVSIEQMKAVADQGKIMPPKTTWIEPKLRSGITISEC